jgi:hypothetical protein
MLRTVQPREKRQVSGPRKPDRWSRSSMVHGRLLSSLRPPTAARLLPILTRYSLSLGCGLRPAGASGEHDTRRLHATGVGARERDRRTGQRHTEDAM